MNNERELKRISLMIGEDQYAELSRRGLNLSWIVRDLLDQFINARKIVLDVSEETLQLHQKVMGTGADHSKEFEPFFKDALHDFLRANIESMQKLEKDSFKKR